MFELGAKVQVFKRGLLFPGRAKKLYELYRQLDSLEQIHWRHCKLEPESLHMRLVLLVGTQVATACVNL
jgi:hypothetical protein